MELMGENRSAVIEGYLTKEHGAFRKSMKRFPTVLRTEYALALLHEKDGERAEKIRKEFERMAPSYPYPHEVDSERELMEMAMRRAEERKTDDGSAV